MSTLSGIFPNAITPTMNPLGDPAQKSQQRRESAAAVFSPVGASEASAAGQNRTGDKPGRDDSQRIAYESAARQPRGGASGEEAVARSDANAAAASDAKAPATADEQSRFQQQRTERQQAQNEAEQAQLRADLKTIRELARRDQEVRAHEQAHQAVGGRYAGAMSLTFEQGPDGKRYAVAGEVPIDTSPIPGDPQATMEKAERIRRAALAPAEPSTQDRAVAAMATQMELAAQVELRQLERQQSESAQSDTEESRAIADESDQRTEARVEDEDAQAKRSSDAAKERQDELMAQTQSIVDYSLVVEQYRDRKDTIGGTLDFLI